MVYRLTEKLFFSIFLVFIFIKFSISPFYNSPLVTYFYYGVLIIFMFIEFLKSKRIKLNLMEVLLFFSIIWVCLIAFINADPNEFFYKKLNSLIITILTIPITYYIFHRDLISILMHVSSAIILIIAILFNIFGTYDEQDPAYILNNFYLHAAFLSGFIIFMSIVLKKHYILIAPLIVAIIIFGSRGPMLAFLLTSLLIIIPYSGRFLLEPTIKTKYIKYFIFSLPALLVPLFLFLPNLFFRTIKRWQTFFYEEGGGDSVSRRLEHFENAKDIFPNDPFFGIGFANYGKYIDGIHSNSYPHNLFLELFIENGILGAVPFLLCISLILINGILNKSWPILFFVLISMQFSYSYAEINELYFALILTIILSKTKKQLRN